MPVPKWRNWQTRMVQVHVLARVWRFKSSLRHQNPSSILERPGNPGLCCVWSPGDQLKLLNADLGSFKRSFGGWKEDNRDLVESIDPGPCRNGIMQYFF